MEVRLKKGFLSPNVVPGTSAAIRHEEQQQRGGRATASAAEMKTMKKAILATIACSSVLRSAAGWVTPATTQFILPFRSGNPHCRTCSVKQDVRRSRTSLSEATAQLDSEGHVSKRSKRRRRAPPSDLQQWMTTLSTRPGGVKIMLDLDNNADAVPQLEAAEV